MSRVSRYSQFGYKRPRHEKRTIPVDGANDDDGQYYQCWYCGFSGNRVDRNLLGDGDGQRYEAEGTVYPLLMPGGIQIGISGSAVLTGITTAIKTVKVGGCAFCGCENYR